MDGLIEQVQLSLRAPSEMVERLEAVAKALDRDRSWVMLRALRHYLDAEGADILGEAAGLASLDRGEGVAFDTVLDEAAAIVAGSKSAGDRKTI